MKNSVNMSLYQSADKIFKKRGGEGPRNFCVYKWRFVNDPDGQSYNGEGNYDRPKNHKPTNLLSRTKDKYPMELCILANGLTKFEAQVYEAALIREEAYKYGLSKRGATDWDGCSSLNKQRERKMEQYIDTYLW